MQNFFQTLGLIAAIVLPLWNLPLIFRIIKRKSSKDLSLWWAWGVWVCLGLMVPSGFYSLDVVWRTFSLLNFILFSVVFVVTLIYQKD